MKKDVIEKLAALITIAFGLIAALAWNGAIRALFDKYYTAGEGIGGLFIYAIVVTIIAVFATIWIGKVAQRAKGPEKKKK
ncbi:MAG: hypothetical protein KJ718_04390 [Nanoarchaeota archaeon]|nr:hypothetical protein [Nanoarchaeota archaeon]MBU1051768.1 hypothetical protein [Nanoarchaeota archaeon]MBU1988351.1 hypothetical protein [Nanoarchaeota archaeon]